MEYSDGIDLLCEQCGGISKESVDWKKQVEAVYCTSCGGGYLIKAECDEKRI